jgi:HEAT repeat protein
MSSRTGTDVLIEQLGDPSRSNQALLALLVKGESAVPALAEFLRTSKPSSLPEPRLLAVEGLSILKGPGALDALIAVASQRLADIADPVIRLAEETVASRAACALAEFSDEPRARDALRQLLGGRPLVGVAEAFEKLRDREAIPSLISWLEEDFVADTARRTIVKCGPTSVPALLDSLSEKHERYGSETGGSQRRRARILEILCELARPAHIDGIEDLLDDPVEKVRWQAVRLFCSKGNSAQQRQAFRVGMGLLDSLDNFIRADCEGLLLAHFEAGRDLIEEAIERRRTIGEAEKNLRPRETTLGILLRIFRKGSEANRHGGARTTSR